VKRTVQEFREDNLTDWAAALTYYGILSIFPALFVFVSIIGVIGERVTEPLVDNVGAFAPSEARDILTNAIREIERSRGGAAILVVVGVALLVAPATVGAQWPWPLTPLTARAVGAWLVGLGWAAGHAAVVDDRAAVRGVGWTGVAFVALQAVALARHGDDLAWSGPAAAAYVVGLAAVGGAGAWILGVRPGR
jgi:hypothetical protein